MNLKLRHVGGICLVLLGILGLAGCGGGDSGSDRDYSGTWVGTTSHGGTVLFTVGDNMVTSLQIVDGQAKVQLTTPVEIRGDFFSAENSEGISSPGSPAVSVQFTFDSASHGSGSYSVIKPPNTWSGTFEASKK